MNKTLTRLATALIFATFCAGGAFAQTIKTPAPDNGMRHETGPLQATTAATGVDLVSGAQGFSTFAQVVAAAGMADTLRGPGPYTIFAPTDEAFARLPSGELDALLRPENRDRLRAIVQYWIVPQAVTVEGTVRGPQSLPTLEGNALVLKKTASGAYTANGANITERDVQTSNGNVQVVDSILLPARRTPPDAPKNAMH